MTDKTKRIILIAVCCLLCIAAAVGIAVRFGGNANISSGVVSDDPTQSGDPNVDINNNSQTDLDVQMETPDASETDPAQGADSSGLEQTIQADPVKPVSYTHLVLKEVAMRKLLKRRSGEGYIDVCVLVVCAMLVLALVVRVLPVYITKQQLDTYAVELVREAEIAGRVGTETTRRAAALTDSTGLDPAIRWSTTGRIQLNDEVTVTLTLETDIGLFGGFGSFPITLTASATGKSEVYWK